MLKLAKLAAVLVLALAPACARAEPPVWVIKDADSTITLFGSIHLLPEVQWKPKAVTDALHTADDVWFEIPLDPASQLAGSQSAIRFAMLPSGQTLRGMLDAPTRARLEKIAPTLNIPTAYLDQLQPWMADLVLSQAFVDKVGARASQGVEMVLFKEVPPEAQLRSFETGEQQIRMLATLPQNDQIAGLAETLRQIDEEPEAFDDIVADWIKGDLSGLAEDALEPIRKASPVYYDVMITRRNADWVKQIKQRLAGSGETLMVVGVGHLVGPGGVPELLRKEGLKVEGP